MTTSTPTTARVYTPWIWLAVFAPYLSLPLLFGLNADSLFGGFDLSDPSSAEGIQFAMFTNPFVIALSLSGWVLGAAAVVFAWLDWRALTAAGMPSPFHWAFGFFSLAGYPVYAIGRAVVTERRTGKGIAVMWVAIGLLVLSFIVAIIWTVTLMLGLMATLPFS